MKRSSEEYILLTISVVGTLSVAPFALVRLIGQEWLIGVVDGLIAGSMFSAGFYVWRKRRVRFASVAFSICSMVGLVAVIYIKGPSLIYWAYPIMATVFFLLAQREAVIINLIVALVLTPMLFPHMPLVEFVSILVTMTMTTMSAYIFADRTRHQRRQLALLATEDSLTGAGNRRAFDARLNEILAAKSRTRQSFSLLVLDLDHFKSINDTYGHETGDEILCRITEILQGQIRASDGLYRIGGEEFVIIAMNSDLAGAAKKAEQLRLFVENQNLLDDRGVTISLGVAEIHEGESGPECLKRADDALYAAKRAGRNTVRTAS